MNWIKEYAVLAYHIPAVMRSMWKVHNGRYFAFRDETNAFLKFVWWALDGYKENGTLKDWHDQCMNEIGMRKNRGDWQ